MIDLSTINATLSQAEYLRSLKKTKEGRLILKNITSNYLARAFDFTQINSVDMKLKDFTSKFHDLTRPNKFSLYFNIDYSDHDFQVNLSPFVKAITVPPIITNKMEFKRGGKTIKKALNQDITESLELRFYQDLDNKVLSSILELFNLNASNYHNGFTDDQGKPIDVYLSLMYDANVNYSPSTSTSAVDLAADFFDINLLGGYKNVGKKKWIDKVLTKNIEAQYIIFEFKNIFVSSTSGFDLDNERINTFSEIICSLDFNGTSLFEYNIFDDSDAGQSWEDDIILNNINI